MAGSLSPATSPMKAPKVSPVAVDARFTLRNGQEVGQNDLCRVGALAERLFGQKGVHKPGGPWGRVPKGQRWLGVEAGALLIVGQKRAQVLAFHAVKVVLKVTGKRASTHMVDRFKQPVFVAPKGSTIEDVQLYRLHPVFSEEDYKTQFAPRTHILDAEPDQVEVPLRTRSLFMWGDRDRILCHCGVWYSRRGLVEHLQNAHLGLLAGPIKTRPPPPKEKELVFGTRVGGPVSTPAVWTVAGHGVWTATLAFGDGAPPGKREIKSGSPRLTLEPSTFDAGPGAVVPITARVHPHHSHPSLFKVAWCLFFTLTVILAGRQVSEACIHDLRLPHLCNKSLADPNAMHPRVFAARPSRALARPCLTVGSEQAWYLADDALQELVGDKRLMVSARHWEVVKRLKHVKERGTFQPRRPSVPQT